MTASILPRIALTRRAVGGGCCLVRHVLIVIYQRIAIWLAMMAMAGVAGLAIALGLHMIRLVLPLISQFSPIRQI